MIIILLISFFLDSIFSNFINLSSNFFINLFTVTSLVVIYPYFGKENKYFQIIMAIGLLYDLVFTNTLFINMILFLIIGYLLKCLYYYLSNNIINMIIISFIVTLFYRFSNYFILVLSNYINFNFMVLLKSVYSSLILNFIYVIILYFIINKIKENKSRYRLK